MPSPFVSISVKYPTYLQLDKIKKTKKCSMDTVISDLLELGKL